MPKFAGREDTGYKKIRRELQRWIKELVKERGRMSEHINQLV
jgi:hypothetical protein